MRSSALALEAGASGVAFALPVPPSLALPTRSPVRQRLPRGRGTCSPFALSRPPLTHPQKTCRNLGGLPGTSPLHQSGDRGAKPSMYLDPPQPTVLHAGWSPGTRRLQLRHRVYWWVCWVLLPTLHLDSRAS